MNTKRWMSSGGTPGESSENAPRTVLHSVFDDTKLLLEEKGPIGITIEEIQQKATLLAGYVIDDERRIKGISVRSVLKDKLHSMVLNATENMCIASENIPIILKSTRLEVIRMLTEYGCTVTQGEHEGDIHYYKAD